MKPKNNVRFSIIVPVYNEEKDLPKTLQSLNELDYPDYEVIVVDDGSNDGTLKIAERFAEDNRSRFRVLAQSPNQGVAAARNRGIREAAGSVLLILNADVLLPKDYLSNIASYYQNGNQWVAVKSEVINLNSCYSRHTAAEEYSFYFIEKEPWAWTEGFSCTKEAAIAAGLFPDEMPGCSGEDVDFGLVLEKKFPGIKTTAVKAPHVTPDNLKEYWHQQKGRGKGRTHYYYYIKKYGPVRLFLSSLSGSLWRVIKMVFGVSLWNAWRLSKISSCGKRDFIPFVWVQWVKESAMTVGIWEALSGIGTQ